MNKQVMMDEPVVDEPVMAGEVMMHEEVMVVREPVPRRIAGRARMARHTSEALHLMARRETGCPGTHHGECGRH